MDPARGVALDALRAITGQGAYANLVTAELIDSHHLEPRDAAFTTELVFGVCRMLGSYDAVIEAAGGRRLGTLQPAVVDVLRLGTHQLLGMRVPPRAALAATVDLAGVRIGERVTGVVNAILRRVAARSLPDWLGELSAGLPRDQALGLQHGHPAWIVRAYAELLPPEEVEAALIANNVPAVPMLVVRPGLCELDELLAAGAQPARWSPWGASRAGHPGQVPAVREGRAGVQDEGSQLVCLAATRAQSPTGRWLDLCAGPGGKSALLRGLATARGSWLLSSEQQPHRAGLVAGALRGYPTGDQAGGAVICADGTRPAWRGSSFAMVMADVPCSGLGALRRRPEARWTHPEGIIAELAGLQRSLARTGWEALQPGGLLAYVTCSPHPAETLGVLRDLVAATGAVLEDAPALLPELPGARHPLESRCLQLWPHRHGTDAMFCALLRKP